MILHKSNFVRLKPTDFEKKITPNIDHPLFNLQCYYFKRAIS